MRVSLLDGGDSHAITCYQCGQSFCGMCHKNGNHLKIGSNCPICRADLQTPTDADVFKCTWNLVHDRSVGRFTASAQCQFGTLYKKGLGVAINLEESVKWYTRAAEAGCYIAQVNLGNCHLYGQGVSKPSRTNALKWFYLAADAGISAAIRKLAEMQEANIFPAIVASSIVRIVYLISAAADKYNGKQGVVLRFANGTVNKPGRSPFFVCPIVPKPAPQSPEVQRKCMVETARLSYLIIC